jgi:hypothetical protein
VNLVDGSGPEKTTFIAPSPADIEGLARRLHSTFDSPPLNSLENDLVSRRRSALFGPREAIRCSGTQQPGRPLDSRLNVAPTSLWLLVPRRESPRRGPVNPVRSNWGPRRCGPQRRRSPNSRGQASAPLNGPILLVDAIARVIISFWLRTRLPRSMLRARGRHGRARQPIPALGATLDVRRWLPARQF